MTVREEEVIRKEIKKIFVASDGTEFSSQDACADYECTYKNAINAAFRKLTMKETFALGDVQPCNYSYDDSMIVVKIRNEKELVVANQWLNEMGKGGVLGADAIGTTQYINVYDDCSWLLGTAEEIKKRFCEWVDSLAPAEESEVNAE